MNSTFPGKWRYDLTFGLIFLAVVSLGVRLYILIRDNQSNAAAAIERQQMMTNPLPAKIGNIYARAYQRYVLLAGSRQKPFCYVDPGMIEDDKIGDFAIEAARLIGADPRDIQSVLQQRRHARYVPLRNLDLTAQQVEAVRKSRVRPLGIGYDWERE